MELVEENQKAPLLFSTVFVVALIAISEGLTHFLYADDLEQSNRFFWLLERSAGFTAYGLLSLSVCLGVSMASALWDRWRARKLVKQLHQFVGLMILAFITLHLWGLLQDTSVPFSLVSLLIPFEATYHPFTTALGVLSLYGIVVLIVSSYAQRKMGPKLWRAVHLLSFPLFIAVTVHGIFNGTDTATAWARLVYAVPCTLFTALTLARIVSQRTSQRPANRAQNGRQRG